MTTSPPSSAPPLDTSPLRVPSTPPELRRFTTEVLGRRRRGVALFGLAALFAVVTAALAVVVLLALVVLALVTGTPPRDDAWTLATVVGACLAAVVFFAVSRRPGAGREDAFRLHRFAVANGLEYTPEVKDPDLPGSLFRQGTGRRAASRVRRTDALPFEVADYRAWIPRGRTGEHVAWSYLALPLPRELPPLVLAARSGERLLDARTSRRRADVDGPWNGTFRLFCDPGAEDTARALLTAPVVARLVPRRGDPFVLETAGSHLFVYVPLRSLACAEPHTWDWIDRTAALLHAQVRGLLDGADGGSDGRPAHEPGTGSPPA